MAAATCSISANGMSKLPPFPTRICRPFTTLLIPNSSLRSSHPTRSKLPKSSAPEWSLASAIENDDGKNDESMSTDALHRFINLNTGRWKGSFLQFDPYGKLLQNVQTRLGASSYGDGELISLIQTLYIRQPSSDTNISGSYNDAEWAEYKIKESNMFTVDKYQQIGFFPMEKAYALRYQTAGMLEYVLRQGVLGEDDTEEESPKNLMIPSRRPSIVCENCLYSLEKDKRIRAFHILDPKGKLEMLLIFVEEKFDGTLSTVFLHDCTKTADKISPFLGKWKGHSITKRSGVYGATIAEADSITSLQYDEAGHLIQDIDSVSTRTNKTSKVQWMGRVDGDLVRFNEGFQTTFLPLGMYLGCPSDVSKNVGEAKSFHLEFCWMESPGKRQRLVRTFDVQGLAVSSTYFLETKL